VEILRIKFRRQLNFIDFWAILTIYIYDLISRIFANSSILITKFYHTFSAIHENVCSQRVWWETQGYYSLVRLDDLNMVKQTSRRCMRCIFLQGNFPEQLHKSRMHRVTRMHFKLFKYRMCLRRTHDILMRFFSR